MNFFKKLFESRDERTKRVAEELRQREVQVNIALSKNRNNMILVEGGTFMMGSDDGNDFETIHEVTVSSFLISVYEVTQVSWESIMGNNPSYLKGPNLPVQNVSWHDAVEFCNRLSEMSGLQKAFSGSSDNITCDFSCNGYRLPTEAEWEYAARGGKKSGGCLYSGSNNLDEVGWFRGNSESQMKEVGKKRPNELGLFDMSGNVWEWCWDWYAQYSPGSQSDPRGPAVDSYRSVRGGCWNYQFSERDCRVTRRIGFTPYDRFNFIGFRLVRNK